ncbi:MAG: VOC family protein [Pseudomonadota bacterium]
MKRFHVHVVVDDLDHNVGFYTALFGEPPARRREDYAQWHLDDPRVNFAISSGGETLGVNHLGIEAEHSGDLGEQRDRAHTALGHPVAHGEVTCCYAESEKHWVVDPQGVAWEQFLTSGESDQLRPTSPRDGRGDGQSPVQCCAGDPNREPIPDALSGACCPPDVAASGSCCP